MLLVSSPFSPHTFSRILSRPTPQTHAHYINHHHSTGMAPSPAQEREALLARAAIERPHRQRSGSYGSRDDLRADAGSRGSSGGSSPEERPFIKLNREAKPHSMSEGVRKEASSVQKGGAEGRTAKDGSTLVCIECNLTIA